MISARRACARPGREALYMGEGPPHACCGRGTDMSDALGNVVATCLSMLLSNEAWQDFGFAKCPRHGRFFERFRPAWKSDLEKKLIQEMLSAFTVVHALADRIAYEDIPSVIAAYTERPDVVTALGYSTRDEFVQHLSERIAHYRRTPHDDWHTLIANRIDPNSIPDKTLSAGVLVGCVRFSINVRAMILVLRRSASIDLSV
jgi:hypothetical protein